MQEMVKNPKKVDFLKCIYLLRKIFSTKIYLTHVKINSKIGILGKKITILHRQMTKVNVKTWQSTQYTAAVQMELLLYLFRIWLDHRAPRWYWYCCQWTEQGTSVMASTMVQAHCTGSILFQLLICVLAFNFSMIRLLFINTKMILILLSMNRTRNKCNGEYHGTSTLHRFDLVPIANLCLGF